MEIKNLIAEFEDDCLWGSNKVKNINIYSELLDKISIEMRFLHWTLVDVRMYLSIIWHRLKKECPDAEAALSKDSPINVIADKRLIVRIINDNSSSLETIIAFNTGLQVNGEYINVSILKCDSYPSKISFFTMKELEKLNLDNDADKVCKEIVGNGLAKVDLIDQCKTVCLCKPPFIRDPANKKGIRDRKKCLDKAYDKIQEIEKQEQKNEKQEQKNEKQEQKNEKQGKNKKKLTINEKYKIYESEIKNSTLIGWDHILIDGSDNFPLELINMLLSTQPQWYYIDKYCLQNIIINKNEVYECLKRLIEQAINYSFKKYEIIPIYDIERNDVSYILPLFLLKRDIPDCVLLVREEEEGKWIGKTILNMSEARIDAYILNDINKCDWLNKRDWYE